MVQVRGCHTAPCRCRGRIPVQRAGAGVVARAAGGRMTPSRHFSGIREKKRERGQQHLVGRLDHQLLGGGRVMLPSSTKLPELAGRVSRNVETAI